MKKESARFLSGDVLPIEEVQDGISRQIMGYNKDLMLVKVWFNAGAEGYQHEHIHSQTTYIESGIFDVTIDNVTQRQTAGDSYFIPPNIRHGAVCVEEGVLLDVFSPVREDFLQEDGNDEG